MKKIIVLTVFIIFAESAAFAQPIEKSKVELGLEISNIKYEESNIMEEEGVMYGVSGIYTWYKKNIMMALDGKFSFGQVDYASPSSGTIDDIDDYIFETRFLIGYNHSTPDHAVFTPYIGLGYRYLNDDTSGLISSTGAIGYERESNYLYAPIGVDVIMALENGWSWGATVEYDLFLHGMQRSHLEDVLSGLSVMDNDQTKGWGARGSIRIEKKTKNVDLKIEPFIKYWDIKKSDETTITYYNFLIGRGWEPANTSTEVGVKFALKF